MKDVTALIFAGVGAYVVGAYASAMTGIARGSHDIAGAAAGGATGTILAYFLSGGSSKNVVPGAFVGVVAGVAGSEIGIPGFVSGQLGQADVAAARKQLGQ